MVVDGLDGDVEAFVPLVLLIGGRGDEGALRTVARRWPLGTAIVVCGTGVELIVGVGVEWVGLLLEADSFFFLGGTAGAVSFAVLACLVGREDANHVLLEHGEGLFRFMGENTEEDVGDILVVIVGEGLLAAGMLVDEISQVQHFLLVEEEIPFPMLGVADPVLKALLHRDNRRTIFIKNSQPKAENYPRQN